MGKSTVTGRVIVAQYLSTKPLQINNLILSYFAWNITEQTLFGENPHCQNLHGGDRPRMMHSKLVRLITSCNLGLPALALSDLLGLEYKKQKNKGAFISENILKTCNWSSYVSSYNVLTKLALC